MLKKIYACIGAAFGDEAKGHIVDELCSKRPKSTINVRFNGGAQAFHTVITPDGKRHAFRHFGSGSFSNVPTFLSKYFIVNLFYYDKERRDLFENFGINPTVYVHPDCIVTTIWDIAINQMIEQMRGNNRHGSVGFGINETVCRSENPRYRITVRDLLDKEILKDKLEIIQNEYVPKRLKNEYGIDVKELSEDNLNSLFNSQDIEMIIKFSERFLDTVCIFGNSILNRFDVAIFEGAQGLALDQNYKKFWPNVTTSNTGIKNIMEILHDIDFNGNTSIWYISRCYATRHGRGLFPTETAEKPYPRIEDLTNIPNEFQETMRYGILDFDLLIEAINRDLKNLDVVANVSIVMTCFDQLEDVVKYKLVDKTEKVSKKQFFSIAQEVFLKNLSVNISNMYVTDGPERGTLTNIKRLTPCF